MPMNIRRQYKLLAVASMTILITGCSVFGLRSVEEAPYDVIERDGKFELRLYEPLIVAQTAVEGDFKKAGNSAFRQLFAYISGENSADQEIAMTAPVLADTKTSSAGQKIEMTAPVVAQQDGESWRYQFVLPAGMTLDSAPIPTNPDVTLTQVPARRMAVLRYSGLLGGSNRMAKADELEQWVAANNLTAISANQWAGFDPPWTLPPFRRNEVMVEVE